MHKWTDIQRAWIAALRSGKYRRGTMQLMTPAKTKGARPAYCCLGVATHLIDPGYLVTSGDDCCVPSSVQATLGLRTAAGDFYAGDISADVSLENGYGLAESNDLGATFRQIADFIEKHPEAVFVPTED